MAGSSPPSSPPVLTRDLLAARLAFTDLDETGHLPALTTRIGPDAEHQSLCFRELADVSAAGAAALAASGCSVGHRVALLLPHNHRLVALFLGALRIGAVPSIVAWPTAKMDSEKYRRNVHAVVSRLEAQWIVTEHAMATDLGASLGATRVIDAAALEAAQVGSALLRAGQAIARAPDAPLFVQFSGGTTGTQKSVPISLDKLHRQLCAYAKRLDVRADDRVISWLPLYHDMGLVACLLLPIAFRIPVTMFAPMEWVMDSGRFLAAVGRDRATLCWLPNFAYVHMAKKARIREPTDLSSLRAVINCSEPVRGESMALFAERFAAYGFDAGALHACYAMAEATFAVTQTTRADPPRNLRVSREALGHGRLVPRQDGERTLTSCGAPVPDIEVAIEAPAPDAIGEIRLRGPFMMDDYLPTQGLPPRWAFSDDGWYRTGDLGAIVEGHLYVTGRKKDVIIVGGVNVFPEDIEAAVSEIPGISPGRAVALGVENDEAGTERLVIVAEATEPPTTEKADALEQAVRKATLEVAGVAPSQTFIVPPRWIVKSTAGKISRSETRARVLERWAELNEGTT